MLQCSAAQIFCWLVETFHYFPLCLPLLPFNCFPLLLLLPLRFPYSFPSSFSFSSASPSPSPTPSPPPSPPLSLYFPPTHSAPSICFQHLLLSLLLLPLLLLSLLLLPLYSCPSYTFPSLLPLSSYPLCWFDIIPYPVFISHASSRKSL